VRFLGGDTGGYCGVVVLVNLAFGGGGPNKEPSPAGAGLGVLSEAMPKRLANALVTVVGLDHKVGSEVPILVCKSLDKGAGSEIPSSPLIDSDWSSTQLGDEAMDRSVALVNLGQSSKAKCWRDEVDICESFLGEGCFLLGNAKSNNIT